MGFDIFVLLNLKVCFLFGLDISFFVVKMVELIVNGKDGYCVECYIIEVLFKDVVFDGNIVNLESVVDCVWCVWKCFGMLI